MSVYYLQYLTYLANELCVSLEWVKVYYLQYLTYLANANLYNTIQQFSLLLTIFNIPSKLYGRGDSWTTCLLLTIFNIPSKQHLFVLKGLDVYYLQYLTYLANINLILDTFTTVYYLQYLTYLANLKSNI